MTGPTRALQGALTRPPEQLTPEMRQAARQAGLGGALRARLPHGHPWRAELRDDAAHLALRHARTRGPVRALLGAWAAAGIPTLIFKGFALSEFEYAPGERFYGDVDVLLPPDPQTVRRAVQVARSLGWRSDRLEDVARPAPWLHESTHLRAPGDAAQLDVHRWIVPALYLPRARAMTLTAGLWRRARAVDWDGVPVWRPDPRDELLLTLVLNRVWGGDHGGLKPQDYLDSERLARRTTPQALAAHARHLGLTHTWAAFQAVCDPARGRLELNAEVTRPLLLRALHADGGRTRRAVSERLGRVAFLLPAVPAAFGDVLWAAWAVRRGGDPRRHLDRCRPDPGADLTPDVLDRTLTAARLVTHLLHPRQRRAGVCVPRAYASYRALRRLGHPAVFVSGVTRQGGQLLSHAWVEDTHGPLIGYAEPHNRRTFRVTLEHPPRP